MFVYYTTIKEIPLQNAISNASSLKSEKILFLQKYLCYITKILLSCQNTKKKQDDNEYNQLNYHNNWLDNKNSNYINKYIDDNDDEKIQQKRLRAIFWKFLQQQKFLPHFAWKRKTSKKLKRKSKISVAVTT